MIETSQWLHSWDCPGYVRHEWRWIWQLPSGWKAVVIDRSQCYNPPRHTAYEIAAIKGPQKCCGQVAFETLAVAKREALQLTANCETQK